MRHAFGQCSTSNPLGRCVQLLPVSGSLPAVPDRPPPSLMRRKGDRGTDVGRLRYIRRAVGKSELVECSQLMTYADAYHGPIPTDADSWHSVIWGPLSDGRLL